MSIFSKAADAAAWLSVQSNRKKVYKAAKYLIPVAVTAGFLSGGAAADILTALGIVLGFAAPHLADKNS